MDEWKECSRTTIQHPWFAGLKAMADIFSEAVPFQEKVRIVIDYDPQETHTKVSVYQPASAAEEATQSKV